jgi:hypothetical protein
MTHPAPITRSQPISFAGSSLGEHRHVCAFFDTPEEEYRTMFPFMRDALERGERSVNIVPRDRTDYLDRMRDAGIDVETARRDNQLEVLSTENTYLPGGHFGARDMLERLSALLDRGQALGFPMTRLSGHAELPLESQHDAFLEYETRLNVALAQYCDPVICIYDRRRVSAGLAFDVLRTHPLTLVGGVLQENPFYVPPQYFLLELRGRKY